MTVKSSNCDKCEHKQTPQGGWCYMFREKTKGCVVNTYLLNL